jgi:hypothetical protein
MRMANGGDGSRRARETFRCVTFPDWTCPDGYHSISVKIVRKLNASYIERYRP